MAGKAKTGSRAAAHRADQQRVDGLVNVLSGMGVPGQDRRLQTGIAPNAILSLEQCAEIYRGGIGLGRKIVDMSSGDMTRAGWEIEGDSDGILLQEHDRLSVKERLTEGLAWSLAFGGGVLVLGLNDLQLSDQPVNPATLRSFDWIEVYDRRQIQTSETDRYPNGLPQWYTILPHFGGLAYRVHESRVIRLDGLRLPGRERYGANQGWGDSLYQAVFNALRAQDETFASVELVVQAWELSAISIANLAGRLAKKAANGVSIGEEEVRKRIWAMDLSRHTMRSVLLDAGTGGADGVAETFEKKTSSAAGLADLLDRFIWMACAQADIPVRRLFGKTTGGLGDSAEGDDRIYFDNISAKQEQKLKTPLQRICELLMACKDGTFQGKALAKWSVRFKSLWQASEKEIADTRKVDADRAAVLVTAGILMTEEVRASFYGGEKYSGEIQLNEAVYNSEKQAQAERELELMKNLANKPPDNQAPPTA
jgi:phage-related protein (TIGR01555 family)